MNLLFKSTPLFIFLMSLNGTQAMQQFPAVAQPAAAQPVSFAQALMKADMGFGTDWLEQFVEKAPDLNEKCSQTGTYQAQELVTGRYNSNLVTTAICRGAACDLPDNNGNTLLHTMARCPWLGTRKEYAYFPEQNLLSVLALTTYQHQEPVVVIGEQNDMSEEERALRSPKRVIETFLLCLKRSEVSLLKPVSLCILGHLIDSSCSPKLFAVTLPQMQDPLKAIKKFPFAWFAHIAQRNTGDDQKAFLKKYAPLFARYRIERAQEIALRKNKGEKDVYELSCQAVSFMKEQKYEEDFIKDAQKMVHLLHPEGFLDRHMPQCTRIIENMLLGLTPFSDFPEWRASKTPEEPDVDLPNNG